MVGIVDVDSQSRAVSSGDAARAEEHRFAGFGLEEVGVEVFDAPVEVIEGSEGGGFAEESDDGGHWEGEEAEEDVDEAVVGLREDHAVVLAVDEEG